MLTITGIDELKAKVGEELGVSDWHEVTQEEIDAFADATGDHQWIHVDPDRAAQSPFGSTIAHGLYTLGLGPRFTYEAYAVEGFAFGVNYGYDRDGNRTFKDNGLNSSLDEAYTYDGFNQLASFTRGDGHSQSFSLDAVGNFASSASSYLAPP